MDNYDLNIRVHIQPKTKDGMYRQEGLSIEETIMVSASNFLEVCEVLGKFNKLAEDIKEKEKVK